MKITHKDLCNLYQAYVNGKISSSVGGCLSHETLNKFFRVRTPADYKTEIIDHITECASCAQEFTLLLEIRRGANLFNQELGIWVDKNTTSQLKKKSFLGLTYTSKLLWSKVIVLLEIILFFTCLLLLFKIFPQLNLNKEELRENNQQIGRIFDLSNSRLTKSNMLFTWSQNELVEYFVLEIFDESLMLIWRSQILFESRFLIPVKLSNEWNSNKYYFWIVTGFTKTGGIIESPLIKFLLID
jgi:hypothetical protein